MFNLLDRFHTCTKCVSSRPLSWTSQLVRGPLQLCREVGAFAVEHSSPAHKKPMSLHVDSMYQGCHVKKSQKEHVEHVQGCAEPNQS